MQAQVPVDSRRYFIDTAQIRGDEGVPPGNYEKDIWHEKSGQQLKRVAVTGNRIFRVDLVDRLRERRT